MSESILVKKLKEKVATLKEAGHTDIIIINAIKEELQHYILNYIFNSAPYSKLIMYGGSLLRIGYELPRMSEDLDFQTAEELDLPALRTSLISHFKNRYLQTVDISIKEGIKTSTLMIGLDIIEALGINVSWSKLKIRFDINYFPEANKLITETIPIVHDNLTYTIKTYPISTLMSSKILAVINRNDRGIGEEKTNCKPRDIYDLIWYLKRNTYPDIEYFKLNKEKYETLKDLLDKLKLRVANLDDNLFEKDLAQFFYDRTNYDLWIENWRPTFLTLINSYKVYKVTSFDQLYLKTYLQTETREITYIFNSENDTSIRFVVALSSYWFDFSDVKIEEGNRVKEIEPLINASADLNSLDYEYIGLFYNKINDFIKRNNKILYKEKYKTRLVRVTTDKFDPKEHIILDRNLLKKIQFEELL
ncbi:nucleotidyl transferase AbiEii/AbiGii toxin family protein [Candidatus Dojkabacteria bacterium]|nr:nucleotidyl transferase AbiEii/AbiGii toxin family protein [Candidatus Dojkabacteria bacterium]